jgi:hypothetical protein
MSIKDLFASVNETSEETSDNVTGSEQKEGSDLAGIFPSVYEEVSGGKTQSPVEPEGSEVSEESILEDYDHDSNPEEHTDDDPVSPDEHLADWGVDVVLYPERDNGLSWSQTFKSRAGNTTVSLSSTLALETLQMDEAAKREVLEKLRESAKVYALPEDQEGFISRTSLIESNMTNPELVVVVDETDYVDAEGNYKEERREFVDSLRQRGAVVVDSVEAAADYLSSYLH